MEAEFHASPGEFILYTPSRTLRASSRPDRLDDAGLLQSRVLSIETRPQFAFGSAAGALTALT
jgi:hypothetical protein